MASGRNFRGKHDCKRSEEMNLLMHARAALMCRSKAAIVDAITILWCHWPEEEISKVIETARQCEGERLQSESERSVHQYNRAGDDPKKRRAAVARHVRAHAAMKALTEEIKKETTR